MMKIIVKDNMDQTVLPTDQKACFDQKSKSLWSRFSEKVICAELPYFLTKIHLKEKTG